jgi:hypothetical protein
MAAHFSHVRDIIVKTQIDLLEELTKKIEEYTKSEIRKDKADGGNLRENDTKSKFLNHVEWKIRINIFKADLMKLTSILIGLLRAIGRFSEDLAHPLISFIYPSPFITGSDFNQTLQPNFR